MGTQCLVTVDHNASELDGQNFTDGVPETARHKRKIVVSSEMYVLCVGIQRMCARAWTRMYVCMYVCNGKAIPVQTLRVPAG